jgi:catechol 2,3-dioxygenase-like lactoylglutathione lyase family enzyme
VKLVAFAATADLERSHELYGGVLGLERVEASGFANAYDVDGTMLRVTRVETVEVVPYTVLGFSVPDLDAAMGRLGAVAFKRYPGLDQDASGVWTAPGGSRIAWFEDPDGNTLSLQQPPG